MKPRAEIMFCCAREGNSLVQLGPCRLLGMGNPLPTTRRHLLERHPRCDVHDRPIVFVAVGSTTHLPPADQERAPC